MDRRQFGQAVAGAMLGSVLLPAASSSATAATAARAASTPAGAAPPAPPFHFSVMLWTIDKTHGVDACVDILAEAGYTGAELVNEYHAWSDAEIRRLLGRMRPLGIRFDAMAGVKTGFADPQAGDALLAELTALLPTAEKLECSQIILLSGAVNPKLSREAQHAAAVENLKRVAELGARRNVRFVIEPIDLLENRTMYLTSVTEAFDMARVVNSPNVRVLYDFYHEQRGNGNLLDKLQKSVDWIGLVHVADVPGRHEPGTGEIAYANIYRKLATLQYDKFVAMEFYPTRDAVASLRAARLQASQAAASKIELGT